MQRHKKLSLLFVITLTNLFFGCHDSIRFRINIHFETNPLKNVFTDLSSSIHPGFETVMFLLKSLEASLSMKEASSQMSHARMGMEVHLLILLYSVHPTTST